MLKAFNFQRKAWRVNCGSFWSIRVAGTTATANLPLPPALWQTAVSVFWSILHIAARVRPSRKDPVYQISRI